MEDIDLYIDCNQSIKIFYYGKGTLEAYIPSISRGRNMSKMIYAKLINPGNTEINITTTMKDDKEIVRENVQIKDIDLYFKELKEGNIIFDYFDNDSEVTFHFKADNMDKLESYLKPKVSGADRSPFSTKNLPKSDYEIPESDLNTYKEITSVVPKNEILKISGIMNRFLKSLCNKRYTSEQQRADMRLKGLSGKEYIHSIGKWNEFIKYLRKELENK